MSEPAAFETALLEEVVALLAPLREAAQSAQAARELLTQLGWDADELHLSATAFDAIGTALDAIQAIVDSGAEPTLATLAKALEACGNAFKAVRDLGQAVPTVPTAWDEVGT